MKKELNDNILKNITGGSASNESFESYADRAIDEVQCNIGIDDQWKMELANDLRNDFDSMCDYRKDAVIGFINNLKNQIPEAAGALEALLQEIRSR